MRIYLAPLQGLTDWIFRESYSEHVGLFDKTFSPFIRVQQGEFYRPSQCNDILTSHNGFQTPIPQFLGSSVESFKLFEKLCSEQGYGEVNINMGCPFPMVTGRHLGAGLLPHPKEIATLLEGIFENAQLKISLKCRLGQESANELETLIPIFNAFPLEEVIIHPRIGKQQYKGEVNLEAFAHYASQLTHPICYNGDIQNLSDLKKIQEIAPQVERFMIGRGILQHPFLLSEIRGEQLTLTQKITILRKFHHSLIERCKQKYSGDLHLLKRLEEMWSYHAEGFESGRKLHKQVKKCKTLTSYEGIVFKALNELNEDDLK